MAKKKATTKQPNPEGHRYPHGDTSANEGADGTPPPTWDPGKVNRPEEEPEAS